MAYNDDQLALIDQRIAAASTRPTAMGTVAYHPGTYYGRECSVTFDGSQVAVPCRLPSTVRALAGDRVCLQKFGSDWVVVQSFTPHEFKSVGFHGLAATSYSINSTTAAAMGGTPQAVFTKLYTDTAIEASVSVGWHTDTGATSAVARLSFQQSGSEVYGVNMIWQDFATTFAPETSTAIQPGALRTMPADTYDVLLMWARWTGAGQILQHDRSVQSFTVREIP